MKKRSIDLYVIPSLWEGLSLAMLAAMSLAQNKAELRRLGAAAQRRVREHYELRERVARLESAQATLLK